MANTSKAAAQETHSGDQPHPIAFKIMCQRGLESLSYQDLVLELLSIASSELHDLSETIFAEQAVREASRQAIINAAAMLNDAMYLAALSPIEASPGIITKDGETLWRTPLKRPR